MLDIEVEVELAETGATCGSVDAPLKWAREARGADAESRLCRNESLRTSTSDDGRTVMLPSYSKPVRVQT